MKASSKDLENLALILDASISPFFSSNELDQLARESGFVQRKSKLNGSLFLDLVVFNAESLKSQSLNDLSAIVKNNHQLDIAKQSLHERFNDNAVIFLKNALEKLLAQQLDLAPHLPNLKGINRILIKDSVCFQIDPSLAQDYPGSGGSGSKASVRIQFEYDIKKGTINDLSLNAFNDQDAKNAMATVELINKNDLIIRDLAYAGLDALRGIVKRSAYYLCRLNPIVKVYECKQDEYVELDFVKIRRELQTKGITMMEKTVFLGKEESFCTRLIIHLMPEAEVNERLRKFRANNKKKGRGEPTAEYIARAHLNLFITNTKPSVVPANQVWNLYRLRWQIELMFKIWKSICDIEKVKKVKKSRLECYIYSRLERDHAI